MSITLKTICAPSNGARFHTADLHIHSFGGSSDVSDATMTVENIIETAVKDGIAILAITDHNSVQNVAPAVAYAERYRDSLLLIPGVEVSTANGHMLVYFAPDKIDAARDFLALIKIQGKHGARDSHTEMSMASVVNEAEKSGGICIAAHIDRASTGFHSTPGFPTWKKDVMCCAGLYGLEFDNDANLGWFSPEDESADEGTSRKGLLGARAQVAAVTARCRLAAVQNSDAHTLADFSAQHTRRCMTRYKMTELSFDAFRTALVDPEARVRALATIPLTVPRVLGMHVTGGFLDGCTFHFSDNLNCIIGGRGTGKSTSIKSLAYGLGIRDELAEHDNCPDSVVVYAEDANGTKYRYERPRGGEPIVQAKEDQEPINEVPADAFRVEFYGQGELSEVGKDPLKNPVKLQEFLDRHISLGDVLARESDLLGQLQENSVQLLPLEAAAGQLAGKQKSYGEVVKKIGIAETGKLQEVVAMQSKVAAEKAVVTSLTEAHDVFARGLSLASFKRDYDALAQQAGPATGDARSVPLLTKAKELLADAKASLDAESKAINTKLREVAQELKTQIGALNILHRTMDSEVAAKVAEFRTKGLTGDLKGLTELVNQRTQLTSEINRINNQKAELKRLRDERADLLKRLHEVREEQMTRRKAQLTVINNNLRVTVEEYSVVLFYDSAGIIDGFMGWVLEAMQGSYFQEDVALRFCSATTPSVLAELVRSGDLTGLGKIANVGTDWAKELWSRINGVAKLHALEVLPKLGKPTIKVMTRGAVARDIPAADLSDGQKHTILLTIAMLAESNYPLIMDQPEDDLDNAFIFSSVVTTLRRIKERRQVIIVTHNANIAVLGDSEILFPMRRDNGIGQIVERGSIDRQQTADQALDILEGGEKAFRRRQEIYGY